MNTKKEAALRAIGAGENGYWTLGQDGRPRFVENRLPRRLDANGEPVREYSNGEYDLFRGI